MSKQEKLEEQPERCPKCKKPTVLQTPAAYYCGRPLCNWSAAKMPPYSGGPVAERRTFG